MPTIFKPVLLFDQTKKDELENGSMAFDITNKKILVKLNDVINEYGGASEEQITGIINEIIEGKSIEVFWNFPDDDSQGGGGDPNDPTPQDEVIIQCVKASENDVIKRGQEITFSYTVENPIEGEDTVITAVSGATSKTPINVTINNENHTFTLVPKYSGEGALIITFTHKDHTIIKTFDVESNPQISINVAPHQSVDPQYENSVYVGSNVNIKFTTNYLIDTDPANNDTNVPLTKDELTINITLNDNPLEFEWTTNTDNNNPDASNIENIITVVPTTAGRMVVKFIGNKNGVTLTKEVTYNVIHATGQEDPPSDPNDPTPNP